jgi:hypothetical protein
MSNRHPNDARRATFAHLAYTSLFERVIPTSIAFTTKYGSLTEVIAAASNITITAPPTNLPDYVDVKDAYHFGVVNSDGAHQVVVNTSDGTTINGAPSITIPASAGAFALLFFSRFEGEWTALVGGGSGGNAQPIVSQTITGGLSPIPNVAPGTVVSLVVAVAATTQHIHMNFDCQVDTEAAPATTITFTKRIDGVISDTRQETVTGSESAIIAFGDLFTGLTVGNHTVDVQAQSTAAAVTAIGAGNARLTTILLPG